MTRHGSSRLRTKTLAPHSRFYKGPFGRMFRALSPFETTDSALENLAGSMLTGANEDNCDIPAGYTYLGQFIDHDITFDPTSSLQRRNDPERIRNFRTPRLDLDNLYGSGPDVSPHLYDSENPGRLLTGKGRDTRTGDPTVEDDLARNEQGTALIGDPRNDENIIVSQLQLGFIKFHNRIMDQVESDTSLTGLDAFPEAQRRVQWHYQWVVLKDFLPRIAEEEVLESVFPGHKEGGATTVELEFFDWSDAPFMPVEFSVAAYRLGHSMIRQRYFLNDQLEQAAGAIPIFSTQGGANPLADLRGGRFLPRIWTVQWDRFLTDGKGKKAEPQLSKKLDTRLSEALAQLPDLEPASLPERNLKRGMRFGLPSGQDVARAMCEYPLKPREGWDADPLWYYVLREAEAKHDGERLGPVGSRIVAEVFAGLAKGDPFSFINIDPCWKPDQRLTREGNGKFELIDLLDAAGAPITAEDLPFGN